MEIQPLGPTLQRRRRLRRAVAILVVSGAFIGSALYWLATSAQSGVSIGPPSGTSNGSVANVESISSTVTRSVGAAQLQTGVAVARVLVAEEFTTKIRVSFAWTNAPDAGKVLLNPNAQIGVGIYRPVHTGECTGSDPDSAVSVDDNTLAADNNPATTADSTSAKDFCAYIDTTASSSPPFVDGQLLLSSNMLTGYLRPAVDGYNGGSATACSGSTTAWCQPVQMTTDTALQAGVDERDQRAMWVIISILTPGGRPAGQVPSPATGLDFAVFVKRSG